MSSLQNSPVIQDTRCPLLKPIIMKHNSLKNELEPFNSRWRRYTLCSFLLLSCLLFNFLLNYFLNSFLLSLFLCRFADATVWNSLFLCYHSGLLIIWSLYSCYSARCHPEIRHLYLPFVHLRASLYCHKV